MRYLIFTFLILFVCLPSGAEEVYPTQPPIRPEGMDQQSVGSCQAESETAALEFYFAELGLPLKLSTFYRHITTWNNVSEPLWKGQEIAAEDNVFRKVRPQIAPYYMWPEDSKGIPLRELGDRPSPTSVVNIDPDYPHGAGAFGYKELIYGFEKVRPGYTKGHRRDGTLEHLKKLVKERQAVTLSMHSYLFDQFNEYTGLLVNPYSREEIEQRLKRNNKPNFEEAVAHSIAVVGYDDSLYKDHGYPAGPGAFIVRNSWNFPARVELAKEEPNEYEKSLLESMRLKVADRNLPGFYAIPYQYIVDLINAPATETSLSGVGGYSWQQINAYQFYSVHATLAGRYQVYHIPYICDRRQLKRYAKQIRKDLKRVKENPAQLETYLRNLLKDSLDRDTRPSAGYGHKEVFEIRWAKQSLNEKSGVNRVLNFLEGDYDDYYCVRSADKFPNETDLNNEDFVVFLEETTREPSPGLVYELLKLIAKNY